MDVRLDARVFPRYEGNIAFWVISKLVDILVLPVVESLTVM